MLVAITYIRLSFYKCFLGHLSESLISHVAMWKPLHLKQWFTDLGFHQILQTKNSGALVHQRTIPTERPPLVDEVSANFSG
jgi:hypothetical protein